MRKTLSTSLCLTALSFAMLGGAVSPAAAQDTTAENAVTEIFVVAQRRTENLQDVPISATAIGGERVDQLLSGGGDVLALAGRAPGLNVESSNGRVAPRFYIRGLGNTDFDLAASQPVSVIMDDVVQENVALKSFPIFDIQQVEVLRGPQGTLYGRNTPAGIVHFRSVRPSRGFRRLGARHLWQLRQRARLKARLAASLRHGVSARGALSYPPPRRLGRQHFQRNRARRLRRYGRARSSAVRAERELQRAAECARAHLRGNVDLVPRQHPQHRLERAQLQLRPRARFLQSRRRQPAGL